MKGFALFVAVLVTIAVNLAALALGVWFVVWLLRCFGVLPPA